MMLTLYFPPHLGAFCSLAFAKLVHPNVLRHSLLSIWRQKKDSYEIGETAFSDVGRLSRDDDSEPCSRCEHSAEDPRAVRDFRLNARKMVRIS